MIDTPLAIGHKAFADKILRDRFDLLDKCERDREWRRLCMARSKKEPLWWCDMFVASYNPRVSPSIIPFILYPRQREMVDWILECESSKQWGICVKARYCGASYVTTMLMLHKLLFQPDFAGCLASNKAASVDKIGSPDCLFEKILIMYKWLPKWMQTIDMDKNRKLNLIRNPALNSSIVGQSGREIGRGGRSTLAVIDEASFIEADEQMVAALSENTDTAIYVSTPNGSNNQFYVLAHNDNISRFTYNWWSDPRRSPEWRKAQDEKLGKVIAAQELDCSFDSDVENQLISHEWVIAAIDAHLKIDGLDRASKTNQVGFDVALGNSDKSVLTHRIGCVVTNIVQFPTGDTTQSAFKLDEYNRTHNVGSSCHDADGLGAGVSATLDNLDRSVPYHINQFHGAGRPSDRSWEGIERTSREMFANKRAEAWYILRDRLKKTYDHLNGIKESPLDNLISIPNNQKLITDLTKPTIKYTSTGKMLLESKADMRKRGLSSPDYGDSLALCFYEVANLDWLGMV